MKANLPDSPTTVDRAATYEEVRAAAVSFPDLIEECSGSILHEIAGDSGGYIRISADDLEAAGMIEEWMECKTTLVN